jgi:hypothetical protein
MKGDMIKTGNFIRINDRLFILNLSYEIDDSVKFVFDEDTPFAIDVINIIADGKAISFTDDTNVFGARSYYNIQKVDVEKRHYYISMYWFLRCSSELSWNDGRGIIFERISGILTDSDVVAPTTNTYAITNDIKLLEIKYRILLPYPGITIENLFFKDHDDMHYTNEYVMRVDLRNFWRSAN